MAKLPESQEIEIRVSNPTTWVDVKNAFLRGLVTFLESKKIKIVLTGLAIDVGLAFGLPEEIVTQNAEWFIGAATAQVTAYITLQGVVDKTKAKNGNDQ